MSDIAYGRFSRRALAAGTAIVTLPLLLANGAHGQAVWGGAGSSTTTSAYGTDTNWSSPPGVAPIASGSSAQFSGGGSASVTIGAGPITPDAWLFSGGNYTVTGAAVNFNGAGTNVTNSSGINSISNNMTGAGISVSGGELTLSGTNAFSRADVYASGTLNAGSTSAFGSSAQVSVAVGGGSIWPASIKPSVRWQGEALSSWERRL
ncbi:hypothetical protein [Tardiphaga alba]|uniref:hypothetical protein n=1 Tax=Tardiphaga alba TaxID=340268 RepID=UPI001BAD3F1F|nr:hypothetical protein [Tardiphaga alba]